MMTINIVFDIPYCRKLSQAENRRYGKKFLMTHVSSILWHPQHFLHQKDLKSFHPKGLKFFVSFLCYQKSVLKQSYCLLKEFDIAKTAPVSQRLGKRLFLSNSISASP